MPAKTACLLLDPKFAAYCLHLLDPETATTCNCLPLWGNKSPSCLVCYLGMSYTDS